MEVAIPSPNTDFDFNSSRSSPYLSLPSTPKAFGKYNYFHSAPASPNRISQLYMNFDDSSISDDPESFSSSAIRCHNSSDDRDREEDFVFDFREQLDKTSLSAEELFDGGKIRPFNSPSRLQVGNEVNEQTSTTKNPNFSPRSRRSEGKKILGISVDQDNRKKLTEKESGRERSTGFSSSNSRRRSARSLSPRRVISASPWEEQQNSQKNNEQLELIPEETSSSSSNSSSKGSRRWRLRDFLLFRSASEGRATDKDPFRKYSGFGLLKKHEEVKSGSFGSVGRRKGPVSAHELHYTVNKSVSEDMKRRTFLPYKEGILGRLAFNPAVHALANRFGAIYRS